MLNTASVHQWAPRDERLKTEFSGRLAYELACTGSVEFRTNGMQGGDAGHGGYLEVSFDTKGQSTTLDVIVDGQEFKGVQRVSLRFQGDDEMEAALNGFEFLASSVKTMNSKP